MNERRFVAERAARWRELGDLLARAQRSGLRALPGREVRRLGALYRAASSDLATARTLGCSVETIRHVNRLCAAAHDFVYASRRRSPAGTLLHAATEAFPVLVRRTLPWHVASTAVCLVAALAAYAVFREDPDLADRTFGPLLRNRAERAASSPEGTRRYLEMSGVFSPFFSWGVIANNVTVSLLLFGGGAATVALGLLSLAVNGVMLGGAFAIFEDAGVPGVLGTFIAAHGPLELTALWIAGGAGLRVGVSWMLPGRRSRLDAFQESGRDALTLLLGTTLLLVVAGLIEGFLSPSAAPLAWKAGTGAVTFALLVAFVARAGRGPRLAAEPGTR